MNNKKDEIKFDEEFLFKYGKLFQESKLDDFYKNIEEINNTINKKYTNHISIFFYISDEDNNVKYAYEQVYNPSDKKERDYFINRFRNLYDKEYKYVKTHDIKKLSVSYSIVSHSLIYFDCVNPEADLIYKKYKVKYNDNFLKIKEINEAFSSLYYDIDEHSNPIYKLVKKIKITVLKHPIITFSIISSFLLLSVLITLNSLPLQTIYTEVLSFSVSFSLLITLTAFLTTALLYFIAFIITNILINITKEFYIRNFFIRQDTYKSFILPLMSLLISLSLLLSIGQFLLTGKTPIVDITTRQYISNTQVPSVLKIKYINKLSPDYNKSKNILYLGTGDTINYFYDRDINELISKNESLYKEVCMGKDRGYIEHLMPLLYKNTFKNLVYRRASKKDISIVPNGINFQEAFCYVKFPKITKIVNHDKNETVLLMGADKNKDINYYYNKEQIIKVLENNSTLQKNLNNHKLWIQDMMQTKALINVPYNDSKKINFLKASDININDINLSKEFYSKKEKNGN